MIATVELDGGIVSVVIALIGFAGIYVTVALPLRKGQQDIKERVGEKNGDGSALEALSTVIKEQKVHGARLDVMEYNAVAQKRTMEGYVENDTAAHEELRELILAQNIVTAQTKDDLEEQAETVKTAVAVAVDKIETAPPPVPQHVEVFIHPEAAHP